VIPKDKQPQLALDLDALGGTNAQAKVIGDMCFTVCALPASHDTDYLLLQMQDEDPLIRKAARMMLDALT